MVGINENEVINTIDSILKEKVQRSLLHFNLSSNQTAPWPMAHATLSAHPNPLITANEKMSIATTREGVLLLVRGRRFVSSRRRRGHRQHRVGPHPQHEEHEEQLQLGEKGDGEFRLFKRD